MATFDTIRLDKGLYATGNFTKALEHIDPDENYKGTALEGLDAYQRQLKRFDIKVSGTGSDVVDKFFKTTDSAALFPEYISRAVRQGMDGANSLSSVVATTTVIDALDYRSIKSTSNDDEKELKVVGEGAFIPQTQISTKENLVKLRKRGRSLVASYESIRFQRLDLFTIALRQIGAYIARTQFNDAVDVLLHGDGNNNSAYPQSVLEPGKLTYYDIVNTWGYMYPYTITTMLANPFYIAKILELPEFKDAAAGLNFHSTGKMITPIGAELINSHDIPEGSILCIDKNNALEMVTTGGVTTEYDKLIDRQLERAVISCTAGFSKIFDEAVYLLSE